jgi:hypothetical protein
MAQEVVLKAGAVLVVLISEGASIRAVNVPNREGVVEDVVLGHPSTLDYLVSI